MGVMLIERGNKKIVPTKTPIPHNLRFAIIYFVTLLRFIDGVPQQNFQLAQRLY